MKIISTCLLFMLSLPLFAGEASKLDVIGFSEDGNYLAFQQYGITDGEGLAFANTYFVDVKENKYAANPIETRGEVKEEETVKTEENEGAKEDETVKVKENKEVNEEETVEESKEVHEDASLDSVRQDNLKEAENQLETLKIVKGNYGDHVISHLLTDVGVEPLTVQFSVGVPLRGANYKTYTIALEERVGEAECFDVGEAKMLTLSLTNDAEKKTKVLQKDENIPKSRGCPLHYRIQEIYLYHEEFVVIFLNVFKPGFEGESMRFLAITGTLN